MFDNPILRLQYIDCTIKLKVIVSNNKPYNIRINE